MPEPIIPVRAKCAQCGGLIKIEYHVPDDIWYEAIPPHLNNNRICLNCFMTWADEKFLPWDETIAFSPCSFHTQHAIQLRVAKGIFTGESHEWHVSPKREGDEANSLAKKDEWPLESEAFKGGFADNC